MLAKRGASMWDVERDAVCSGQALRNSTGAEELDLLVTAPMFVSDKPLGYFGLALRGASVSEHAWN